VSFIVVIPARYASTRLPGKPLLDIAGKPLIQRVYEQATQSQAQRVIIATDDKRIDSAAQGFGADVCMTSDQHRSGTERLAEVCQKEGISDDTIVVNLQGDEPLVPPQLLDQVANNLARYTQASMSTLCVRIHDIDEVLNPHAVKVVFDKTGYALYFSRAPIPWDRDDFPDTVTEFTQHKDRLNLHRIDYYRHIGLYAYRAGFIRQYLELESSPLEHVEALEQLRVLYHGHKIHIEAASAEPGLGVDTQEDLDAVIALITAQGGK
jgi:3-deoxy-manno-octulosonate cytidylyltransferase (CMP-KDO synthetase)